MDEIHVSATTTFEFAHYLGGLSMKAQDEFSVWMTYNANKKKRHLLPCCCAMSEFIRSWKFEDPLYFLRASIDMRLIFELNGDFRVNPKINAINYDKKELPVPIFTLYTLWYQERQDEYLEVVRDFLRQTPSISARWAQEMFNKMPIYTAKV